VESPLFSVDLLASPQAYAAGEPVFAIEPEGCVIRSAVVTAAAAPGDERVNLRYCVPANVMDLFGSATHSLYGWSQTGIEEAVSPGHVHPMAQFEAAASPDGTLAAGTIVLLLRREFFRVTLAALAESVPPGAAPGDRFETRALAVDPSGRFLAASAPPVPTERVKFVLVTQFREALGAPPDPAPQGAGASR
jgi:hypothetical protein